MLYFFADASCTLFRVEFLVSMVAVVQDDVLGSGKLSRELDELREKCEALERGSYEDENVLGKLWEKAKSTNSLWKEVNWYGLPSTLVAQIARLDASLAKGDKHLKNDF